MFSTQIKAMHASTHAWFKPESQRLCGKPVLSRGQRAFELLQRSVEAARAVCEHHSSCQNRACRSWSWSYDKEARYLFKQLCVDFWISNKRDPDPPPFNCRVPSSWSVTFEPSFKEMHGRRLSSYAALPPCKQCSVARSGPALPAYPGAKMMQRAAMRSECEPRIAAPLTSWLWHLRAQCRNDKPKSDSRHLMEQPCQRLP